MICFWYVFKSCKYASKELDDVLSDFYRYGNPNRNTSDSSNRRLNDDRSDNPQWI
jgi:hypothetical protein